MRKSRFNRDANYPLPGRVSRSNIPRAGMIKEQEAGMPMPEVCRSLGRAAFYNFTSKYGRRNVLIPNADISLDPRKDPHRPG